MLCFDNWAVRESACRTLRRLWFHVVMGPSCQKQKPHSVNKCIFTSVLRYQTAVSTKCTICLMVNRLDDCLVRRVWSEKVKIINDHSLRKHFKAPKIVLLFIINWCNWEILDADTLPSLADLSTSSWGNLSTNFPAHICFALTDVSGPPLSNQTDFYLTRFQSSQPQMRLWLGG